MIRVGSFIRVKPIEKNNGVLVRRPAYASPSMCRHYDGNTYGFVIKTSIRNGHPAAYFLRIPNEDEPETYEPLMSLYWYLEDLEEIADPAMIAHLSRCGLPRRTGDSVLVKYVEDVGRYADEDLLDYAGQILTIKSLEGAEYDWVRHKFVFSYYLNTPDEDNTLYSSEKLLEDVPDDYVAPPMRYRVRCERCGSRFYRDEFSALDNNAYLCPDCRKRLYVAPYHRYRPPLHFYSMPDENTNLYFGTEIEVGEGGESDMTASLIMRAFNPTNTDRDGFRLTASHDSSLRNGIEFVTAPMTFEYHKSLRQQYAKIFHTLVTKGYRAHDTGYCGLHVHFSRIYFGEDEETQNYNIDKLLMLVNKFWEEITIFSRRHPSSLDRYAKKCDMDVEEYRERFNKSEEHDGHYYAVNVSNVDTIEFRMFKGTLNVDTYMCTLELVNRLVHLAKEKTPYQISQLTFDDCLETEMTKNYFKARCAIACFESEN